MKIVRVAWVVVSAASVVLLAGCAAPGQTGALSTPAASVSGAPTNDAPSPVPTKPAIGHLVLTPDGLGYIKVGQPVRTEPAATAIVSYDPTACSEIHPDIEREPGSPGAGGWFSTYVGDRFENFEVVTDELSEAGAVIAIDVYSPAISTDKGIHAGSTVAELTDAYPSIDRVVHTDRGTDIYVEDGTAGRLLMEVSTKDYYGSDVQPGHVLWIRAVRLAVEPYSISSSDAVGACPF